MKREQNMKKIFLVALLASTLAITGCSSGKKNGKEDDDLPADQVEVRLPNYLNSKEGSTDYKIRMRFDDEMFKKDAKVFDKELAMLSFGNTLCAANTIYETAFYARLKFDADIKFVNYDKDPTPDTIGYSFAHKKIGDSDLLAISVRGFDYQQEWSNNLYMGETGNHAGFQARSDEIYADLKATIEDKNYQNLKLWIMGYSRGGGISNVLSHQILSNEEVEIEQKDMFVYTFEAPRGLTEENAVAYENVHNVVNNADLVTYVAPVQYGLYRCGVDVDIYTEGVNLNRLIFQLDKDIQFPAFTPKEGKYENEQQLIEFLLNSITADGKDADKSAHTRQDFVNNYQSAAQYMLALFFSLENSTVNKIMTEFQNLTTTDMLKLFNVEESGLYNFLKPILDADKVQYDDSKLHPACDCITKLLQSNLNAIIVVMGDTNSLMHCVNMHMPETEYVLLNAYQA